LTLAADRKATELYRVNPARPEPERIEKAAAILRRGGLVAFPTETVYGLGADALNPDAVRDIFTAKGRPADNPLIAHIADKAALKHLVTDVSAEASLLMERFWPGPDRKSVV
jgi:L-threonylcarbamoyladenylate synthase